MTSSFEPVVVPLSKTKLLLLLVGSLAFVLIAVFVFQSERVGTVKRLLVIPAGGFFTVCGCVALWKLFDAEPGLIIDESGIVDNASGVAAGHVPWFDVLGFKVTEVAGQRFLTIEVRNPEAYVRRARGLKRWLVTLNARFYDSPIQISAIALRIDFDRLVAILTDARMRYDGGSWTPGPPVP